MSIQENLSISQWKDFFVSTRYKNRLFAYLLTMTLGLQIAYLFLLAIPVACISWTITHEEIFREPREFCVRCSKDNRFFLIRKFFYLFTCEYCFSHYVTIGMLFLTRYQLLIPGWKGYLLAGFSLVWVANIYMSLFYRIRIDIKKDKVVIEEKEKEKTDLNPEN